MQSYTFLLILIITHLYGTVSKQLYANEGDSVTFDLPGVEKCGNYQFLNPQLSPLIIIKNQSAAAVQAAYVRRTSVYVIDNKLRLTLENLTPIDRGKYRVYTKTGDVVSCSKIHHFLNVKAKVTAYLSPWSAWTSCYPPCDPSVQRSRERNCSVSGGCRKLGHLFETDSCPVKSSCPVWAAWGIWSSCSTICGRGQRSRSRACFRTDTALTGQNVSCMGDATQNTTCESKPCRSNATFWSSWGPWGPCNLTCGGGYRQRTREARFPGAQVVESFEGWRVEEEQCNTFECEQESPAGTIIESESGQPVAAWVIGCICAVFIIVLILVILLLVIKLRKKKMDVMSIARSFQRSRERNKNKPISPPKIPRKASEPNAYIGVKVATPENNRKSKAHNKNEKKGKGNNEIASSMTLSVDSLSYTKRAKSGKRRSKRKSVDSCNSVLRISAPIHDSNAKEKSVTTIVYDTPRNSVSASEDTLEVAVIDSDDTYELPESPAWDEDISHKYEHSPDIIVTEEPSVNCSAPINTAEHKSVLKSLSGLSDSCSSSPTLSRYPSKSSSYNGLSNLYDTPRSSYNNLTEIIYDVPRHTEPLYVNENFHISDEEFYVTPKTSVSSMHS